MENLEVPVPLPYFLLFLVELRVLSAALKWCASVAGPGIFVSKIGFAKDLGKTCSLFQTYVSPSAISCNLSSLE